MKKSLFFFKKLKFSLEIYLKERKKIFLIKFQLNSFSSTAFSDKVL